MILNLLHEGKGAAWSDRLWICVPIFIVAALSYFVGKLAAHRATTAINDRLRSIRSFTQDAGHELATPVAIALNHLQVLHRELQEQNRPGDHLATILAAVERMSDLVNDLRFLSRSSLVERHGNLSILSMDKLVDSAISSLESEFALKGIIVNVTHHNRCDIVGDQEGWQRVFSNLLKNALNYCHQGNHVGIEFKGSETEMEVSVSDNGPGIAPDEVDFVFERFYRSKTSTVRSGTGLGLAIVKAVVDSQGGEVSVSSKLGEGTTFTLKVPRNPKPHPMLTFLAKDTF